MRFQVPQFIDIEDKIVGPFTIKQFVYLVGGAGMVYIIYTLMPLFVALLLIVPLALLSLSLAFVKPFGKPFVFLLQAAVRYAMSNRLYLWKHKPRREAPRGTAEPTPVRSAVPSLSESKLKDLTWALDINQTIQRK